MGRLPTTRYPVVPSVSPFRALRYDESVAGPLTDLVAPPYDVIDDETGSATSTGARTTSST